MSTSTLYHKAQTDQILRKLGRLGGLGETAVKSDRPHLRLVSAAAPVPTLDPVTMFARTVDSSGRLKLTGSDVPSARFGWEAGSLDVDAFEGWLVLRQSTDRSNSRSERFGSTATLSRSARGTERISLRPAHLELVGLPDDRQLFLAVFQDPDALVVASPRQMFASISENLRRTLSFAE
jgi:hypothetical protein